MEIELELERCGQGAGEVDLESLDDTTLLEREWWALDGDREGDRCQGRCRSQILAQEQE